MEHIPEIRPDMGPKVENSAKPLEVPYVSTIRKEAERKIEGHDRSLGIVFDEINRQSVDNFSINSASGEFEGVKFSFIKLSVTEDLIRKINPNLPTSGEESSGLKPKHYVYFLQPAFALPPGGSAFGVLDLGVDRFIREMPKIRQALKKGQAPPKIDIFLLGSPFGFGGKVTPEWVKKVKNEGLEPHGRMYARFIEENLPKEEQELANTRVILQGLSRGVVTASETSKNLSEDVKRITQRLFDVPVGYHEGNIFERGLKAGNISIGMGTEFIARKIGQDETTKILEQKESQFYKDLASKMNIPEQTEDQKSLQGKAAWKEAIAILKGTPFDSSERTFVRVPEFDPVNVNIKNLGKILANNLRLGWRKKFLAFSDNKIFYSATSRKAHFYSGYKKSFGRWEKIMALAERQ